MPKMLRRLLNRHYDWSVLPYIILAGLAIGSGMGHAVRAHGPALAVMVK